MSTIPFDTHAFYVELVESGLAEKTANALTKAVTKIEQAKIDELATKHDLKDIELKIELVRSELKRDIAESKSELQRFIISVVFGTAILQTAIVAALILKLAGNL